MEHRVIWDHLEAAGAEHVKLKRSETHMEVNGTVLLVHNQMPHRLEYEVKLDLDWKTKTVKVYHDGSPKPFVVHAEKQDKWWVNGEYDENLDGATNVDLTFTPFSNMLPINRVSWKIGERRTFKMVYVDVMLREVQPLLQVYTYLGDTEGKRIFQYKCRDYETALVVDQDGWVVEYPGAFIRKGFTKTGGMLKQKEDHSFTGEKSTTNSAFY
ncbi:putative glycolipid-binding domain-containing protein [Halobacillus sp. H74]|uniref:putative glycolipid-binding domain-containing protein n=1 Tax=Halobacillus sp. H74 TaxID=3457436 RepID=UPI003FCE8D45